MVEVFILPAGDDAGIKAGELSPALPCQFYRFGVATDQG